MCDFVVPLIAVVKLSLTIYPYVYHAARVGDCHIRATSETSSSGYRNYSCIVPDNLNPNYDVHILSVYEAIRRGFRQHPTGTSYVSLVVSGEVVKPIILVLVSYEPIEWRLSVPSGVEIERVLLVSSITSYILGQLINLWYK